MEKMRFRQVHLDFHTSSDITGIGKDFDKKEFQNALKIGHVNSITLFSKCHHGYSFHPTKANIMHPGLDFDLLGAQLEACREIGVRAPVYISAGFDEKYAFKHPDETVRFTPDYPIDFLNTARYHCLCFNTPYLDTLLAQIKEVMEIYNPCEIFLDICDMRPCYCNHCLESMRKKGYDPHNEKDVMQHGREVYFHYAEEVEKTIHAINPETAIFHNAGRLPFDCRKFAEYDTHFELESLPTGGWGYDHFPLTATFARSFGKEYLGMTGKFHRSWGEFGGFKHPNALRYETSLSLALGAKCSIGDQLHPSGKADISTYKLIGEAYSEVEKKEEYCADAVPVADIAVFADRAHVGANRIMLEKKYLYNIVDETCPLDGYKLVILPDRIPYTEELADKLKKFLSGGGKILASGYSCKDENGRFLGENRLVIKSPRDKCPSYMRPASEDGFINGKTDYVIYTGSFDFECEKEFETVAYGKDSYFNRTPEHFSSHAHTPADPQSLYPGAVISDNIGYISWMVFHDYEQNGSLHLKELVSFMIDRLIGNRLSMKVSGLPDRGIATLFEQKEKSRLINHLLFAHTSVRGDGVEVIEDTVPVYNVEVEIKSDRKPQSVTLEPDGEEIPFVFSDGIIKYSVPKVDIHAIASVNF